MRASERARRSRVRRRPRAGGVAAGDAAPRVLGAVLPRGAPPAGRHRSRPLRRRCPAGSPRARVGAARSRPAGGLRLVGGEVDRRDLAWIGVLYAGVVGLLAIAFVGFTTDDTAGLFIAFAAGLLLGVVGPLVYTRRRGRPFADLGLTLGRLPVTIGLGLALAGVQFALTLWGYDLPADREDWLPLLLMALVVGLFEAIFFRGFVQDRLVASFGEVPASRSPPPSTPSTTWATGWPGRRCCSSSASASSTRSRSGCRGASSSYGPCSRPSGPSTTTWTPGTSTCRGHR